jgi:hypothetical protein
MVRPRGRRAIGGTYGIAPGVARIAIAGSPQTRTALTPDGRVGGAAEHPPMRAIRKRALGRIAAAARRLAGPPDDGLHRCPDCGLAFVCPLEWEIDGDEHWLIRLRCGACEASREVRATNEEAKAFDLALDRQVATIQRALNHIDREQMRSELEVLVAALDRDLIEPRVQERPQGA